ncbi:hypothetical protein Hanom_Chr05g00397751 [Helianthus anomalus]
MARREGEYLFAGRVSDRGNDMSVFYSRARGEDRHPTRRVADRGSDGVYLDPRDLKIKRLRQRVRDLEEIRRLRQRVRDLEEIRRLQQQVRDIELQQERHVMETKSRLIAWDHVNKEEENPFSRYPPRFYELNYHECLSEDEPRFDEDGSEPEEEECSFVWEVLNGIPIIDEEPMQETIAKVSVINFDEFVKEKKSFAGSEAVVVDDCDRVVKGGRLENTTILPISLDSNKLIGESSEVTKNIAYTNILSKI